MQISIVLYICLDFAQIATRHLWQLVGSKPSQGMLGSACHVCATLLEMSCIMALTALLFSPLGCSIHYCDLFQSD